MAQKQLYSRVAVLDFEATCDDDRSFKPMEIIEFPVVVIDTETKEEQGCFHQYVRPVRNPILKDFCTQLTGITQDVVSKAKSIEEVYAEFLLFTEQHQLTPENTIILTCGDWDLKTMWPSQAKTSGLGTHPLLMQWCNVKHVFRDQLQRRVKGLPDMLQECGLELEGRHHSGIDDVRNIVRCVKYLLDKGVIINATATRIIPAENDKDKTA